ncbi:Solute carrier family 35 member F2 [Bagarius yarrelli]|uniref:Solute carrier family 35 member F2 n=1 Tax=Bagarius yarrelli TaxID=175774 RepID=A0A556U6X2_BAGYA|nr:Solute carrier family 35 member F2 [Bagarius yarrelli]
MSHEHHESICEKISKEVKHIKWREIFTWKLLKTLVMGQGLSAMICGTAVTSQYLATEFHLDVPALQSFINYTLLCLTYTTALCFTKGSRNFLQILRSKWWKYLLLGLADVEANYAVVKAYQYTTLTSIQLLDCFILPVLLILSRIFLKTRYRIIHYVAVCVCLAGVGAMVGADLVSGRDQGSSSNILLGDGLVIISATLYAVSNLCQEYIVKNESRLEFLGMIGLFGELISGIQLGILEHTEVANIQWTWQIALLLCGFSLCMYTLYSCMPVVINLTSATAVNLSMLTSDIFSLFFGLYLFQYTFSGLYVVSLMVIMLGFIMFNAFPTLNQTPEPAPEDRGHDNPAAELDEQRLEGAEDRNQEKGGIDCREKRKSLPAENGQGQLHRIRVLQLVCSLRVQLQREDTRGRLCSIKDICSATKAQLEGTEDFHSVPKRMTYNQKAIMLTP